MKKIVFITGTRADYGKIKSVMKKISADPNFQVYVYVTGMHLLEKYGSTYKEIIKDGFTNYYLSDVIDSQDLSMDEILAHNVLKMSVYVKDVKPDMIFVHGDRVEALAATIVGAMNNIYVSHIEGGEITGTIDNSIRHAISKFSNFHFVSNESARNVLIQLGENKDNIYVSGSPDIDIMLHNDIDFDFVKKHYDIGFEHYGILIYHPVTTDVKNMAKYAKTLVDCVLDSNLNYIVIGSNNDLGSEYIYEEFKRFEGHDNIKMFPSIRFEYFLNILKNADFVIGNSSLGIREAGVYGVPTINIGNRQNNRFDINLQKNIICVDNDYDQIKDALATYDKHRYVVSIFGDGKSDENIYNTLLNDNIWTSEIQKLFYTIS